MTMRRKPAEETKIVKSFSLDQDIVDWLDQATRDDSRSDYVNEILRMEMQHQNQLELSSHSSTMTSGDYKRSMEQVKAVEKKELPKEKKIKRKRGRPRKRTEADVE